MGFSAGAFVTGSTRLMLPVALVAALAGSAAAVPTPRVLRRAGSFGHGRHRLRAAHVEIAALGLAVETGVEMPLAGEQLWYAPYSVVIEMAIGGLVCTAPFPSEAHGTRLIGVSDTEGNCGFIRSGDPVPTGAVQMTTVFSRRPVPYAGLSQRADIATIDVIGVATECAGAVCVSAEEATLAAEQCPTVDLLGVEHLGALSEIELHPRLERTSPRIADRRAT
jgi:hypothetical protein